MDRRPSPPRIAVILVVDQVGSTNFLVTHGDAAADRVNSEFGATVRSIVEALGGTVEGSTGDGYVASFGLGSAGLDAGVEIQRAVARLSEHYPQRVQLRVGLAIGEVHHDGVDLRGWPLFHATRLCDAAGDGAILASRTLLDVVATRSTHAEGAVHQLELKGLAGPSEAVEIEWHIPGEMAEVMLAPELALLDERPWVGRADLVTALLDAAMGSESARLVVVAGEPGAGKSRLVARFAAEASKRGHLVMYGAAPRDLRSSYGPIVDALRTTLQGMRPDVRSSVLAGTAGRELTRLLPDLGGPGREILHPTDGPGAHRLLMEGIAEIVGRLAQHANGLTLVADDLQWADDDALATLRHLAGPAGPRAVTVIGVVRAAEADKLTSLVADVARSGGVERLDLEGLGSADIAALLADEHPGLEPQAVDKTAAYLAARTGGNALFVTSLVHHPAWLDADLSGDGAPHLPEELSVAIAERLDNFDSDDLEMLTTASVIGQRFPARLLVEVANRAADEVADTVGRARQAGLLQDHGGGDIGFVHDLVRLALMPPEDSFELAATHRTVAEHLDQDHDPDIAATAGHYLAGLAAGADRDKAVTWSVRAAQQAMLQLSYAKAVRHFCDAIDIVGADDDRAYELAVQLGRAQLDEGDPAYRETLLDAVDRCLHAGLTDLAAEAALANNRGLYSSAGAVDHDRIKALERVLAAAEHDPAIRSELTAVLAVESVFTGASGDQLDELSQQAVDLARQSGDQDALAHALSLRQIANYRIDNLHQRLAETDELLELTADVDPRVRFWAVAHRAVAAGEAGHWDEVAELVTEAEAIAAATRAPVLEWHAAELHGALAIQRGELREAQTIIDHGYELGLATGQPDALIPTSGQQCEVLRRRGRFETIHSLAAQNLDEELLKRSAPMRAVLYLEEGNTDRARDVWQSVGLAGALDVPSAQVGHNLLHARRLCRAFDETDSLEAIEAKLADVPPFLYCNYWEPTAPTT